MYVNFHVCIFREKLNLSRNKYVQLYQTVEDVFPSKNQLEKVQNEIKLPLSELLHGKKSNLSENMAKNLQRLFIAEKYIPDENTDTFTVKIVPGFDGYVFNCIYKSI